MSCRQFMDQADDFNWSDAANLLDNDPQAFKAKYTAADGSRNSFDLK